MNRAWKKLLAAVAVFALTLSGCSTQPAPAVQDTAPQTTIIDETYDVSPHLTRGDEIIAISSPSQSTTLTLCVEDGQLCYEVVRAGSTYMKKSPMGLTVDGTAYGSIDSLAAVGEVTGAHRTDIRPLNGRSATATGACIAVTVPVGGMTLEARVYDNGIAFRYVVAGEGRRTLQSEQTAFVLPAESGVWAGESHKYYETINKYYDPSRYGMVQLGTPATIKLEDGGYAAILEGDLSQYPGIKLEWASKNRYNAVFAGNVFKLEGTITSPWRIISVADDLNELVNNTIVYLVNDPAVATAKAVRPGRAAWSWITGRTTDRVTPALMEDYTDLAAKLGFEYNIIDEGWVNWSNRDATLQALAAQGEPYGVGQILWTGVTAGAGYEGTIDTIDEAKAYIDYVSSMNMAGAKIDFFTTEDDITMGVDIYEEILAYAAQKGIVINFHGCNKPTGQDATYPNELNREAILGLESTQLYNYSVQAQMFVTQPFVRNLAGHADYTPAAESAFHLAQLVLTDAPMQAIGSDPELLLESEALEMLRSVPTVWQQTVVLPQSDIGKTAVIARKGGNASWYVGGINYKGKEDTVTLDLSLFLGDGTYRMELWTDNGNAFETTVKTVTKADTVTIPFEQLSGFIVRFDRVTLSQYGGEIKADSPVTVSIADADTVVRYTLDGSEPTDSSPALANGDTLPITNTCTLTIKIMSGADSGYTVRYRFNKMQ